MMNNLAHVEQFLDEVPKILSFDKVISNAVSNLEEDRRESMELTLSDVLDCAKKDMRNKLDKIIFHIKNRVSLLVRICMISYIYFDAVP